MKPNTMLRKKEEQQERLQAIFRETEEGSPARLAAVRDLLDEVVGDCSRDVEDLRRENATLREQVEERRSIHRHESREALEQVRTYAEELTAANEELRLTNEELHQINETLTEQKEELVAARKIAETEQRRYYDLFDAAPDGYLVTDPDGTIREANRAASSLLAVHKESLRGRNLAHFVGEGSREEFWSRIALAADGQPQRDVELRLRPLEGEPVYASVSIAPVLPEEEGLSLRWMVRDITERKRVEEALQQSEEKYRNLVQYAPTGIYEVDFRIPAFVRVNDAMCHILGYTREELLAMNPFDLMDETGRRTFRERIRTSLSGEDVEPSVEYRIRGKHGRDICAILHTKPIYENGRPVGAFVVAHDITERKRAEKALIRRTEDLIRLNREVEAARDEANVYLDIMTHDVRNANNVSSMYADLLLDLVEGNLKAHVEKLHASIDRSSEILQNVATIRRMQQEPGRLVPVNLDAVIREEVAGFPDAAIRYAGTPVSVLADSLLPVIVTNLVGNAVKFGGPDATVTVRVEERGRDVLVSVEDTGPGVPDEVKERLFTRFERGRASGRGQGLGLFIVRTLVTRYGGRVWVDDRVPGRPEEGAAFRFTLRKV